MQWRGDELEFKALGVLHFLGMCVTVLVRLLVAAVLLYVGVWWLQYTTSLEDLVLNAAALSFIMDFDELMFSTMLTLRGRTRLGQLRPLPLPSTRTAVLSCARPLVVSTGLAVLILTMIPSLQSNVRTMEELDGFLCGGNLNFVFTSMPPHGFIITSNTTDHSNVTEISFEHMALKAAVWDESAVPAELFLPMPSAEVFSLLSTMSTEDLSHPFCEDDNTWTDLPVSYRLLSYQLDMPDGWSCSDVPVDLCSKLGNTLLRWNCPVRCGCREARSPLYLTMPSMGCPVACVRSEEYLQTLNRIPCSPTTAEQMQANVNWSAWLRGRETYAQNWDVNVTGSNEDYLKYGCQVVTNDTSLCHETSDWPGLGLWCPVECGCREPKWSSSWVAQVQCPSQCDAWGSRYEARLNQIPCVDGKRLTVFNGGGCLCPKPALRHLPAQFHR